MIADDDEIATLAAALKLKRALRRKAKQREYYLTRKIKDEARRIAFATGKTLVLREMGASA